ncbi:unnamed protein product [Closterium sp. NIES-54]
MASLRVLAFDHEGPPLQFDTWLDDLQLYLLSNSRDCVSLFDHTSGAAPTPLGTADSATRSHWVTRDTAARLAIRNHLPLAECAHFGQHRTAQALYDAVVARYSLPATAYLGRLLLPYLFLELSAFATVEDLVSHLRTSDARYCAAAPLEFLDRNQPPMFITLYFIVTRLPDSLRSVRDHFISFDPTVLTIDLLKQHLLAAETNVPSAEDVGAASDRAKRRCSKGKGGRGGSGGSGSGGGGSSVGGGGSGGGGSGGSGGGSGGVGGGGGGSGGSGGSGSGGVVAVGLELSVEVLEEARGSSSSVGARPRRPSIFVSGCFNVGRLGVVLAARMAELLRSRVAIFDLDYDAILSAMYAVSVSAEGDCYWCVPLDLGIEDAALGASESSLPGTAPAEALHTFTLDSGASRCFFHENSTLTPLSAPVVVRLADPSRGPVVARSPTLLPCPEVPSGSLSRLHLPSFSTNVVSTAALQDAMVTTIPPGCQRVSICTCTWTGRHLATSGSTPLLVSPRLPPDSSVAPPPGSPLPATPSWHALPSRLWSSLVSASPTSLAYPALPSLHRGAAARCSLSSSFPLTTAPLQTLHMDVWVFPFGSKGQVVDVLIPWIRAVRLQLRERFRADLPVLRLHSDRGGDFSSELLRDFCRGEGLLQSFTLPDSPQQNGIAEHRNGLVMEVGRTSMIHAAAPYFLWPFAVWYAAHQLNLWPRVSFPETSPTLRWTGKVGDASWVWGSRAFVRDTSADKLSARAIPCGRAPSGVSQVDPLPGTAPVEVAVGSGAARGAASGGAASVGVGA